MTCLWRHDAEGSGSHILIVVVTRSSISIGFNCLVRAKRKLFGENPILHANLLTCMHLVECVCNFIELGIDQLPRSRYVHVGHPIVPLHEKEIDMSPCLIKPFLSKALLLPFAVRLISGGANLAKPAQTCSCPVVETKAIPGVLTSASSGALWWYEVTGGGSGAR